MAEFLRFVPNSLHCDDGELLLMSVYKISSFIGAEAAQAIGKETAPHTRLHLLASCFTRIAPAMAPTDIERASQSHAAQFRTSCAKDQTNDQGH